GYLLYFLADSLHRRRVPNNLRKAVTACVFVAQQNIFGPKPGFFEGMFHQEQQVAAINWLLKELISALFHRRNSLVDRSIGGKQNYRCFGISRFGRSQDFEPVSARHFQICYYKRVPAGPESPPGLCTVGRLVYREPSGLQSQAKHLPEAFLVF